MTSPRQPTDERAREFWIWFQTSPHSESRDVDCVAKLTNLLDSVRDEALEEALRIVEGKSPFAHEQLSDADRIRALKSGGKR